MTNEYVEIIRAGLAILANQPKPSWWQQELSYTVNGENAAERACALAITKRLRARRLIQEEARQTFLAQAVAVARIDRLLNGSRQQSACDWPPVSAHAEVDVQLVFTEAYQIMGRFYHLIRWKYRANDNIESYQSLLSDIDDLPRRFRPPVCDAITKFITDTISF